MSKHKATDFQAIFAAPYWAMNGVNVFSANLVRGLQAEGVSARILLTERHSDLVTIADPLMPLPEDLPVDELPVAEPESWGGHWLGTIRYLEACAPCIYIPNSDWRHSVVCPRLSSRVGVVGVVHSDDPLHYDHVARLGRYWDAIVTTSPAIAERVKAEQPRLANRVSTIPIGVPVPDQLPQREQSPDAPLRLIYHGVLNQNQKRVLDFPRIVDALLARHVPVQMTVVGDGPDRERLAAASGHLVESGAMRFVGVQPHDRISELLAQHDAYVLASAFEGMPNALNEAMGHGCVPVVTDIRSGIPEVVRDGVNGYRVPVGDTDAFAERLALLHGNPERRAEMAKQAHRTVVEGGFRTQDMVRCYQELFCRVLDTAERRRFRRPPGRLRPPPREVAGVPILPGQYKAEIIKLEKSLSWTRGTCLQVWDELRTRVADVTGHRTGDGADA